MDRLPIYTALRGASTPHQFNKGQMVKVEKTGFDDKHKKHIWKILSVYWPMTSNMEDYAEVETP